MKDANGNLANDRKQHGLKFLNVVRVFPDNMDFTIAEIRRQHTEVGLTDFALSLSLYKAKVTRELGSVDRVETETTCSSSAAVKMLAEDITFFEVSS